MASKPARIRYYVDADVLGLAHVLVAIRPDVTYPGDPGGIGRDGRTRPPCPILKARTDDDVWIPRVAELGWIVITKDSAIASTTQLREIAIASDARLLAIAALREPHKKKQHTWDQFVALASRWHEIEKLEDRPGPWMYRVRRTSLTAVDGFH